MIKKIIERIKKDPQKRMNYVLVIAGLVAVVYALAAYLFILSLANDNLKDAQSRQDVDCTLTAKALEYMTVQGASDEELVDFIVANDEIEGDSWPFLIKADTVIFAKNKTTTAALKKMSDRSLFMAELANQNQLLTSRDFADQYTYGRLTDKERYSISGYAICFAVLIGSLIIIGLAAIVYFVGCWTNEEKRCIHVKEELRVRNEEFERFKNSNEEYYETNSLINNESSRSGRYKQYAFKFYINARHAIYIDGKLGAMHPHTWELHLHVLKVSNDFVQFNEIEKEIRQLIDPFQDKEINSVEPFNVINPTLENCCNYFRDKVAAILKDKGWLLLMLEMSETPSRSYVVNMIADDT